MVKLLLILASVNFWLMAGQFQLSQPNNSLTFSMGELNMEQVGE